MIRPTTQALRSRHTAPRTGPQVDADICPGRSRPAQREGRAPGLAGLALAGPTVKLPLGSPPDSPLSSSVSTSHSTKMGPSALPVWRTSSPAPPPHRQPGRPAAQQPQRPRRRALPQEPDRGAIGVPQPQDCMHRLSCRDKQSSDSRSSEAAFDWPSSDSCDRPTPGTTPTAVVPDRGPLPCVGRGALVFLLVGVSTTLANSGYMARPQIEARPTCEGSGLGPVPRSQAERMVRAMTAISSGLHTAEQPHCSTTAPTI